MSSFYFIEVFIITLQKLFLKALFLNILFKKNIKFRAKKQSEYGEFSKLFAKF